MIALPFQIAIPKDFQIDAGNDSVPYSYDELSAGLEFDEATMLVYIVT